jgi:hypothetical protein
MVMGLLFGFGHSYRKTHHVCSGKSYGLVYKKFVGLQHSPIGGNQAASGKQNHLTRNHLFGGYYLWFAIAQYRGLDGHLRTQFLNGVAGPVFLHKAEHCTADDYRENDDSISPLTQKGRDNGCENQDQNQGPF